MTIRTRRPRQALTAALQVLAFLAVSAGAVAAFALPR